MTALWRLMPGLDLRYRTWDNEAYVLYNNLTGDTHLADAAAIEVLELLHGMPAATQALAHALGLDDIPDNVEQLTALLAELQGQALIESVATPVPPFVPMTAC